MTATVDALANELEEPALVAALCRHSFADFVREFWSEVPGAGTLVWNWHLDLFCTELQTAAERVFRGLKKTHDLVLNVSPGTSKSTVWSILFPAWVWTRMPTARILTASHTDELVLDLANKSRQVIRSDKYHECFPEVLLHVDQDAKGYYRNTLGGDRKTCTVAGKSPMGFHADFILIDDPIDPKKVLSQVSLTTAREFMTNVIPSRKVNKAVTVTMLVMQRLGVGDPTDVMLSEAKKEGAAPIRYLCLPSDLDRGMDGAWVDAEVSPRELAKRYVNGMMDPYRLGEDVLREYRARGAHYFATQFRQRPYTKGGGMFKDSYFIKQVKAAPYESIRIRYWDRAATQNGGCNTAGTLICRDADGNFYVENCVVGQWEPEERDRVMLATAQRDRARYGPKHEPKIYIEHEPGSSGVDAYRYTARKLAGFPVRPDRPSGDKETRAEPWSSQCAAGNVYLVVDGTWDVQAWIAEHCAFPGGPMKDRVDSSSGAFLKLLPAGKRAGMSIIRVGRQAGLRIVVTGRDDLGLITTEQPTLLFAVADPARAGEVIDRSEPPPHALVTLMDHLTLDFADLAPAEVQLAWEQSWGGLGRLPADLVMAPADGKKLWAWLLRKRSQEPGVIVIADAGGEDRRGLSLALAIADVLRLPRGSTIYRPAEEEWKADDKTTAPNAHVYAATKQARGLVM